MFIQRNMLQELHAWKKSPKRKPLMLLGARQVGKTHLLKEFGKAYKNFHYFSIEGDATVQEIFEQEKHIHNIVNALEIYIGKRFEPNNTLICFDEIQASEKAIMMLKYFCEDFEDLHIVCAGSLLGVSLNRARYANPVGKVTTKFLYPLTFDEFLGATGNEFYKEKLEEAFAKREKVPKILHEKLMNVYRDYLCVGGMPAAVVDYVEGGMDSLMINNEYYDEIIRNYLDDMSKYANYATALKCRAIYQSIPEQLLGDTTKFKYSTVKKRATARDFNESIEWLLHSRVNIEAQCVTSGEIPLGAHIDNKAFKIYLSDIGLLRVLSKLETKHILRNGDYSFKGALTENYVAIHLKAACNDVYYFKNNNTEVDFLTMIDGNIIPIEVKSGIRTRSNSLNRYIEKYNPKYAIRISAKNMGFDGNILSLPLYAVYLLPRLQLS